MNDTTPPPAPSWCRWRSGDYSPADLYHRLVQHAGCDGVRISIYGDGVNVALECGECGTVIIDADDPGEPGNE